MATWYLIAISYYAGFQPIPFDSHKSCIDAREVVKKHIPSSWGAQVICVKK